MLESFLPEIIYVGLGLNVLGLVFFILSIKEGASQNQIAYEEDLEEDVYDSYDQDDEEEDEEEEVNPFGMYGEIDLDKEYEYKGSTEEEWQEAREMEEEKLSPFPPPPRNARKIYQDVDLNVSLPETEFEAEEEEEEIEIKHYEPLRYQMEEETPMVDAEVPEKKKSKKESMEEIDRSIQDRIDYLTKEFGDLEEFK